MCRGYSVLLMVPAVSFSLAIEAIVFIGLGYRNLMAQRRGLATFGHCDLTRFEDDVPIACPSVLRMYINENTGNYFPLDVSSGNLGLKRTSGVKRHSNNLALLGKGKL